LEEILFNFNASHIIVPSCRVDVEIQAGGESELPRPVTLYYPSTCVKDFLEIRTYDLKDFYEKALAAIHEANKRVRQKWGVACSGCAILEQRLNYLSQSKDVARGEARVLRVE
jgi:uncharacterized repeat protein (TIGR04042 family)